MQMLYQLMDNILPFDWAQYIFMKNALIAVLLVTPLFGLLGTMVVNNRMAFYSEALGHSALTGIGIGVLMGLADPQISMIGFSVLLAVGISYVKNSSAISTDTVIGVFSAIAVSLGIVILSRGGNFNKYSNLLIGDLLSITPQEIALLAIVFVIIIIFWLLFFNRIMLVSINRSLAHSRGVNTILYETLFAIVVAIVVTISIQWVGLLIITSLLVLPSAAARNISRNIRNYTLISLVINIISGLSGLIISYYWGTATGATIVLMSALLYFLTLLFKPMVS